MTWFRRTIAPTVEAVQRLGFFGAEYARKTGPVASRTEAALSESFRQLAADTVAGGFASDSVKDAYRMAGTGTPPALLDWFAGQTFIGHQACALLAQHWLIAKACEIPARDAVRMGYEIAADDGELPEDIAKRLRKADKRFRIAAQMVEFVTFGRVFGIRIALPLIDAPDPVAFYENPFNPDGITPGSYRGVTQVDPQWCSPELDTRATADPTDPHFYEPTWWNIRGRRYHRSHLIIYRNGAVPDLLKPAYRYGGVPVPQRIMERVYGAEKTANEVPLLVMTKRLNTLGVNTTDALADMAKFVSALEESARLRDNYGVRVYDKEAEEVGQLDTSLADLDAVVSSQFQLVAAAANVPVTKLMGTTPKGFNATGEYDESNYHEDLESIQAHDLAPLLERHHLCVMRSEIAPRLADRKPVATQVVWNPLDSPTSAEAATTQKTLADRDAVLAQTGAIDAVDIRQRLARDEESGYYGVVTVTEDDEESPEDPALGP